MTADRFRALALALPEASEGSHMGHADFRVRGKVFATLGPQEDWGMVKLTSEQQAARLAAEPASYHAAGGAWGRRGCTIVTLNVANELSVERALIDAWRNTAPKPLAKSVDL